MAIVKDFETKHFPTWCPGCGDWGIWTAVKQAIVKAGYEPHQVLVVFGIGCSGNMANVLHGYGFHGLHGRALPVAHGAKMANRNMKVIVIGGDGDGYGEGLNHFLQTMRGNPELTYIVHDNQVYGLTKGQTSPTSEKGFKTSSTPEGVIEKPINPLSLALAAEATFVAQGFAGNATHLINLIVQALKHPGFGFVNVLQPCVTFNHHNTFQWFYRRVYDLAKEGYAPNDRMKAIAKAREWGDKIPLGVLFQETRDTYEQDLPQLSSKPLVDHPLDSIDVSELLQKLR
jgi:2-oxoglutarate ferredoxin oxidoreductase subunit beta